MYIEEKKHFLVKLILHNVHKMFNIDYTYG